jgi:hypothetical protein
MIEHPNAYIMAERAATATFEVSCLFTLEEQEYPPTELLTQLSKENDDLHPSCRPNDGHTCTCAHVDANEHPNVNADRYACCPARKSRWLPENRLDLTRKGTPTS